MDLVVRNARVAGSLVDIGVADGRIVAIGKNLGEAPESYDAQGRLACAGLVETHIHLDKSRLIDRLTPETGRRINPMRQVAAIKHELTVEDIRRRAAQTLEQCILNGATRMRTQVEVDPAIGMRGFDGVASLIADYRWAIDIEICVFPQDGLTNYPGTDELLVEALKRGAKAIGGAPRYDADHAGQIRRIFELAREFDAAIDIHLDVGDTPEEMDVPLVCELTEKYRRGGRVTVGHMAKLSTMPPTQLAETARRMADVGVAVTVLPLTDLFVMGRDQDHNIRRGVADANFLVEHGVNCSLSTNNVLNPVTPVWRLLADPDGQSARQRLAGRPRRAIARNFRDADRALGPAPEPRRLRAQGRQPGRHRHHRRRKPRAGDRRNPPAARRLQAREADGCAASAGVVAARRSRALSARR